MILNFTMPVLHIHKHITFAFEIINQKNYLLWLIKLILKNVSDAVLASVNALWAPSLKGMSTPSTLTNAWTAAPAPVSARRRLSNRNSLPGISEKSLEAIASRLFL